MESKNRNLNEALREAVRKAVPSTEKILWTGNPEIRLFQTVDWIQIPFSILWFAGVCAICSIYVSIKAPFVPFGLIAILFLSIGFYYAIGRFFLAYYYLKNCTFVLTENSAYTISTFPALNVRSMAISPETQVTIAETRGQVSAIHFEDLTAPMIVRQAPTSFTQIMNKQALPSFFYMKDADAVLELLKTRGLNFRRVESDLALLMFGGAATQEGWRPGSLSTLGSLPTLPTPGAPSNQTPPPMAGLVSLESDKEFKLLPGETFIWQGKPDLGLRVRRSDVTGLLALAACLTCLVQSFFYVSGIAAVSHWVVFAAATVLMFILSAASELMIKASSKYAVTNKRVLALSKQGPQVRSYAIDLTQINSVHSSCRNDDSGTIVFNKKNNFLVNTFGAEGVTLDPRLTSRSEPFFLDIPKVRSVARMIEQQRVAARQEASGLSTNERMVGAGQYLARRTARNLPDGAAYKLAFTSGGFAMTAFTAGIVSAIAIGHMVACWPQLQALLANLTTGKTLPQSPEPPFLFVIPVILSVVAISLVTNYIRKTCKQISLLKMGTATKGTYVAERVVCSQNHQAWLVERQFEFFDRSGFKRLATALVNVKTPIQREVTVLFDLKNPDNSLVVEELPGNLRLTEHDNFDVQRAATRK